MSIKVIQYDTSLPYDELMAMYEHIREQHKDKFIFIPNTYTFKTFDLKDMEKLHKQWGEIIEQERKRIENQKASKHG